MDHVNQLLEWAWARHHNPWSWYIRPLFILPFCYFAWRRSLSGVVLTVLATLTSIAWFPAPETPSPEALRYLEVERRWLSSGPLTTAMVIMVGASLWLLAGAFWTRRWFYGVLVLNAATLSKVAFSVTFGGEAGWASLTPSIATLAICNAVFAAIYLRLRRERYRTSKACSENRAQETPKRHFVNRA
jgi:hypothetical protein